MKGIGKVAVYHKMPATGADLTRGIGGIVTAFTVQTEGVFNQLKKLRREKGKYNFLAKQVRHIDVTLSWMSHRCVHFPISATSLFSKFSIFAVLTASAMVHCCFLKKNK